MKSRRFFEDHWEGPICQTFSGSYEAFLAFDTAAKLRHLQFKIHVRFQVILTAEIEERKNLGTDSIFATFTLVISNRRTSRNLSINKNCLSVRKHRTRLGNTEAHALSKRDSKPHFLVIQTRELNYDKKKHQEFG